MNQDRLKQIEDLYHAALEREPEARAQFLKDACSEDEPLREEVSSLLLHQDSQKTALEAAAGELSEESEALTPGTQLGSYHVLSLLGKGGMGEVYRARDSRLRREVAIKVLPQSVAGDAERIRRFEREAQLLASLNHPNIAAIYSLEESNDTRFLVLELVEGETLADRLKQSGPVPVEEFIDLGLQIVGAVEVAHSKGVIHRDLKPTNILVTEQGRVKVLDFGLAKLRDRDHAREEAPTISRALTESRVIVGTPAYMSPEQAGGEEVDGRTDLFSLGAVLYELATGNRAFPQAWSWPKPPTSGLNSSLAPIVEKLLEPDREQRYQTAAEVGSELRRLGRSIEPSSQPRWWWLSAAAAVVLALVFLGVPHLTPPENGLPVPAEQWVQLTNFPDSASQPALSPDGRMLTFIRGPGAGSFVTPGQIYSRLLPEGAPVALTEDDRNKMSPVFSPDGSQIAYTVVGGEFNWDTWQVATLGGEPGLWLPNASGLVWTDDDNLLFSEIIEGEGLHMKVVAAGQTRAEPRDIYVPEQADAMAHRSYPSPDGEWAIVVEMDETTAFLPCRLVSVEGTGPSRQVGPLEGSCTFAAWSPDGDWMYFTSSSGGANHIWRQEFPDGDLEQVTSGATQEEGITISPDGSSLVTAVALRQSSVWISDANGEREVSLEGFAFDPELTPDGRYLLYRILRGPAPVSDPSELWVADLESGRRELFLPEFSLVGFNAYDVSSDSTQVVVAAPDTEGISRLWLAPLDRSTAPRQVSDVAGDEPFFAPGGDIVFRVAEGTSQFAFRIGPDGSGLRRAIEQPVTNLAGLSPGGEFLVAMAPVPSGDGTVFTQVFPLDGGDPVRLYSGGGTSHKIGWSADGRYLYLPGASGGPWLEAGGFGETMLIPIPPGQVFPDLPPEGFTDDEAIAAIPGVRVIDSGDVVPGPSPDVYAFSRQTVQRNLYRVPIP